MKQRPTETCCSCGKEKAEQDGSRFTDKFGETIRNSWECYDCVDQTREIFAGMQLDVALANEERYQ
jgi:hypothetical protein